MQTPNICYVGRSKRRAESALMMATNEPRWMCEVYLALAKASRNGWYTPARNYYSTTQVGILHEYKPGLFGLRSEYIVGTWRK